MYVQKKSSYFEAGSCNRDDFDSGEAGWGLVASMEICSRALVSVEMTEKAIVIKRNTD